MAVGDGIDETHPAGFARIDVVAREHHREGLLDADEARQQLGAAAAGQQAEHHLGQGQARLFMVGRDAVGAGQGHLQAAAHGRPVDGRHRRRVEGADPLDERMALIGESADLRRLGHRPQHLEVGAGDEGVFLPADEDDGLDPGILLNEVEDAVDGLQRLGRDRVDLCTRLVDPDDGNIAVFFYREVVISHGVREF